VTDGALKAPLSDVTVRVEGTALRTTANTAGKYTIAGVAPRDLSRDSAARGVSAAHQDVTVAAGAEVTLDFALVAAPTRLGRGCDDGSGRAAAVRSWGTRSRRSMPDSIAPTARFTQSQRT